MIVTIKHGGKTKRIYLKVRDLNWTNKEPFPEKLKEANETLGKGGLPKQIAKSDQTIQV